ncbi:MAG: proteasome assembly chaperone family protein [Ilumatobacteraceae bacterium]
MSDLPDLQLHGDLPELDSPILVVALKGWIDAAEAAAEAVSAIESQMDPFPLASYNTDVFIDYRARRPTMEIRDGRNTHLEWPSIDMYSGHDANGRDIVLLTGSEPDSAWHRFAAATAELCRRLGVTMMVGLGAYPFPTPHTRPSRLSATTPSQELVQRFAFLRTSVDVPAGMGAVLEHSLTGVGIPSITLWAQVPQYLPSMSYPAASVALLDGLTEVCGLQFDRRSLEQEAIIQRDRLDRLVSRNAEHAEMVGKLEAAFDASQQQPLPLEPGPEPLTESDIPTPDELAAELEAFLRDSNPDTPN